MVKPHIFLGFPLDKTCLARLETLDPAVKNLYIIDLQEYVQNDCPYLGKTSPSATLETLQLLQDNIYSLLKKLFPDYPLRDTPLQLFPIIENTHDTGR